MNAPVQPNEGKPKSNAWIGLLIGFALLALVVWANSRPAATSDQSVVLTSANWQKEVVDSDMPVVVDFWATWCGPCKALVPTIHRLANTYAGRVKFGKLDVDQAQDIAEKFNIRGLPTVMIFKRGKLAARPATGLDECTEKGLARSINDVLSAQ